MSPRQGSHLSQVPITDESGTWHRTAKYDGTELNNGGSDSKESACKAGDLGSIPGLGRSPGGQHGNPPQYSCLENPVDRGSWWAIVHGVTKSWTQLSN